MKCKKDMWCNKPTSRQIYSRRSMSYQNWEIIKNVWNNWIGSRKCEIWRWLWNKIGKWNEEILKRLYSLQLEHTKTEFLIWYVCAVCVFVELQSTLLQSKLCAITLFNVKLIAIFFINISLPHTHNNFMLHMTLFNFLPSLLTLRKLLPAETHKLFIIMK